MQNDSIKKTILVALVLCLVCSVLVSGAAVALKSAQDKNKRLDLIQNILVAGGLYAPSVNVLKVYQEKIVPVVADLSTGRILSKDQYPKGLDVQSFDIKKVASDPTLGQKVPAGEDIAKIRRKPKYMVFYEVVGDGGKMQKVILPIYGYGLWSTLYGFIALDNDLKTIRGLTYYEEGETPGLGGEVENPKWKKEWQGKEAFDPQGDVAIKLVKGGIDPNNPNAKYEVDGLSGATMTTRGVENMMHYWLGDHGYGPLLDTLKQGGSRG